MNKDELIEMKKTMKEREINNKKIIKEIYENKKDWIGGYIWDMNFEKSEATEIKSIKIKEATRHTYLIIDGEEYMAHMDSKDKITEVENGYRIDTNMDPPVSIFKKERKEELTFSFGRFKGKRPDQVTSSYLKWITQRDWFNKQNTKLSNECIQELEYRNRYNYKI